MIHHELLESVKHSTQESPFSIERGFQGVERIKEELGENIPSSEVIRAFRPNREWFLRPHSAADPDDLHHEGHTADAQILAVNLIALRRLHNPTIFLADAYILETLSHHDTRVEGDLEYPLHAKRAADHFRVTPRYEMYPETAAEAIAYMIEWHSLRHDPPLYDDQAPLLPMLYTLQDADASLLVRPSLHRPIEEISLRTVEAREYQFPHIGGLLFSLGTEIGKRFGSEDLFENEIRAAEMLGLLQV